MTAPQKNVQRRKIRRQESSALHRKETIILNDDDESLLHDHAGSTNPDTNNLDDHLLKCAIDQSLSTQEAPEFDAVQPIKEVQPKSMEEAFEQTLNGFPNEQFTLIEITRKDIVTRTLECIEDEDLKARVSVKFIGEDAIDSGGVTREFFSELFCGFGGYSMLVMQGH